jgi:hypothetical protein
MINPTIEWGWQSSCHPLDGSFLDEISCPLLISFLRNSGGKAAQRLSWVEKAMGYILCKAIHVRIGESITVAIKEDRHSCLSVEDR